jgi:hypothetical protein
LGQERIQIHLAELSPDLLGKASLEIAVA